MFIGLADTMNQLSYNLCKEVRAKIIIKFVSYFGSKGYNEVRI